MSIRLPTLRMRISYQTNILGEDGVLFGKNLRVRTDSFPERRSSTDSCCCQRLRHLYTPYIPLFGVYQTLKNDVRYRIPMSQDEWSEPVQNPFTGLENPDTVDINGCNR